MSHPLYRGEHFPTSPQQPSRYPAPYGAERMPYGAQAPQNRPYGPGGASGSYGAGFAAYGPPQQPYGGQGGPGGRRGRPRGAQQPYQQQPYPYDPNYGPGQGAGGAYHPEGHPAAELPLAPIHRRALARMMDAGIVWAFGFALIFPIVLGSVGSDGGAKGGEDGGGWTTASLVTTFIVLAVLPFVYEAVQLALWGHTLGKRVMALSVVRVQPAGDPLPMTQAVWRSAINNVGYQLAIFFFLLIGVTIFEYALILMVLVAIGVLIAYLWAIFDQPLHQAIHDRFAGTVVVDDRVEAGAESGYEYE